MASYVPIIVGVGDYVNRSKSPSDALEPLDLILHAITSAIDDTTLTDAAARRLQSDIDSVDIVRTWTWPYRNLPGLVAARLGIRPKRTRSGDHGHQPAKLLDCAARRVSQGETRVALLGGGEALASLAACAKVRQLPPLGWTSVDEAVSSVYSPTTKPLKPGLGAVHGMGNPINIYPLYENSLRAHRQQSRADNHAESSALYGEFAAVAAQHPYSWSFGRQHSSEQIGAVSETNRIINSPYPLLMNAFNTVNLAAAVLVTSTDYARDLGIPESQWVYALGGASTQDNVDFWQRSEYWWSPSISRSLDAALDASGLEKGDVGLYDFYSCFPVVPKLACRHLGLPMVNSPTPITILGGLTFFGGAGNNYSMHAITEMTRQLRQGRKRTGLILANGGVLTYHAVVCLSRSPRHDGLPYPSRNPLADIIRDVHVPQVDAQADGEGIVETYTVEYSRNGSPRRGLIVGRLKMNGHRFLANHADIETLQHLCRSDIEPIGRTGWVQTHADGRNLFSVVQPVAAKL